ncbi:hypothetical protein JXA12_05975 [Candidatus Woesearchaeota archaeon]|nr:hypothetical protein [Candidatus Woesearchaeota archaeon]
MEPVPNQQGVTTGEEGALTEIIDTFFLETKEYIDEQFPGNNHYRIDRSALLKYDKPSDEELLLMRWHDRVVAGVLCSRTDLNNVQYTFFRSLDKVERLYSSGEQP